MGRTLADRFPRARAVFDQADETLGFSLSRLAWDGPADQLVLTKNAQLAIFVHSLAVYEVIRDELPPVGSAAGHSLGEISAYVVAGTLSYANALEVVRVRGESMFRAGEACPGTMAAVLGLSEEEVDALCREGGAAGVCVPANRNAPGQVVISGDVEEVKRVTKLARERGAKRVLPLRVSGAFHSPLMDPAQEALRGTLSGLTFRDPLFPVFSNVTARAVRSGEEARESLVRQLVSTVRWSGIVRAMSRAGVGNGSNWARGTYCAASAGGMVPEFRATPSERRPIWTSGGTSDDPDRRRPRTRGDDRARDGRIAGNRFRHRPSPCGGRREDRRHRP